MLEVASSPRTPRLLSSLTALALLLGSLAPMPARSTTLAPGFQETVVFSGHYQPTAVRFAPDGRVFLAEKSGLVWSYDDLDDPSPQLVVDLRAQVHNFWDRGLLGLAVDPAYPTRPFLYVFYAHDVFPDGSGPRWGTGDPSPSTDDPCPNPPGSTADGCVVFGRLSRIVIDPITLTGSEEPLLSNNWCQQYPSHSAGDLVFGEDGYLYLSAGDGSSFTFSDWGQDGAPVNPCGDPPDGVGGPNDGPSAEGGSLRSLDVLTPSDRTDLAIPDPTSFDGSILRLDVSGTAVEAPPDNPLVLLTAPTDDDLVIATGLRNPFRIAHRPGTDEIWAGDVGWESWEEINRVADPGGEVENFGWPCFEGGSSGSLVQGSYQGQELCQSLYLGDVPPGIVTRPPYFAYRHSDQVVPGELCGSGGSSITGLAFYTGGVYPPEYQGALIFADSTRHCLWTIFPGADGEPDPSTVTPLVADADGRPVDLQLGPDGRIYHVDFDGGRVYRLDYFAGNQPPVAVATATPASGPAPLAVQLDGSGSTDAEDGTALAYAWDLDGDGELDDSTEAAPTFTYTVPGPHTVTLEVADSQGATDVATVTVTVGSSPPQLTITAPSPDLLWRVGEVIDFAGEGFDSGGDPLPSSSLSWEIFLHHCYTPDDCHTHTVTAFEGVASGSFDAPDHEYPSFLELRLSADGLPPADWFDPGWTARRRLTLDNSAQSEELTDFPLLVVLDDSRIDYARTQADGSDLRFVDEFGNLLAHEVEAWDPGGTSAVWVRVPAIAGGSGSGFVWMYYGNPAAPDLSDPAGVWSSGYAAVWHLDGALLDATAHANHGLDHGTGPAAGKIGEARSFDGAAFVEAASSPSLEIVGQITLEAWVRITDPERFAFMRVLSKKDWWEEPFGYNLEYNPAANQVASLGSGTDHLAATDVDLDTGWHYLVATVDGGQGKIFVDGRDETDDPIVDPLVVSPQRLTLGRRSGGADYFVGDLDEVRISDVVRSADWIAAQHAAMTDDFVTFGPEELSSALGSSTSVELQPRTVTLSFASVPPGLELAVGSHTETTPFDRTLIVGSRNTVSAPSPQTLGGVDYTFESWSDGGAQSHIVTAPETPGSWTASYASDTPADKVLPVTAGLVLHLETDSGQVTTDGGQVTGWDDLSRSANHLAAAGGPTLVAATPTGHAAVRFDGVGDRLERLSDLQGFPGGAADRTVFAVVDYRGTGFGGATYGSTDAPDGCATLGNRAFGLVVDDHGDLTVQGWCLGFDFATDTPGTGAGWLVQSAVLEADQLSHYKNGTLIDQLTHTFATDAATGHLVLGAELDGSPHLDMDLAALLLYDRALDESERTLVEDYLQEKYLGGDELPVTAGLVLHLETDPGQVTTAGGQVTGWDDLSGSANHLTAAGDPTLVAATPTGRAAVRFDGIGDRLERLGNLQGFPAGAADRTVFAVVDYRGTGFGGATYGSTDAPDGCATLGNRAFGLVVDDHGDLTVQGWCLGFDFATDTPGTGAGWLVQSTVLEADQLSHYKNGTLIDQLTHTFATDAATGHLVLGAELDGSPHLDMDLAALLLYDRALDESERALVEGYLEGKYLGAAN